MILSNFDKWLTAELSHGLADIKFAIVPGKGISSESVQDEILAAEAAIAAGFFRDASKAMTSNTPEVQSILNAVTIH